jgi:hypothetical protein
VSATMFEIKGEHAGVLSFPQGVRSIQDRFLNQSAAQIAAAGDRQVVWVFAEASTAEFARKLFKRTDKGRDKIRILVKPWQGKSR